MKPTAHLTMATNYANVYVFVMCHRSQVFSHQVVLLRCRLSADLSVELLKSLPELGKRLVYTHLINYTDSLSH